MKEWLKVIRNEDISSATLAVPPAHSHLRLAVALNDGTTIILQEATVAAIVRAYTTIKTHPVRRAVRLVSTRPDGLKKGFAFAQLIEVDEDDLVVEEEMGRLLDGEDT